MSLRECLLHFMLSYNSHSFYLFFSEHFGMFKVISIGPRFDSSWILGQLVRYTHKLSNGTLSSFKHSLSFRTCEPKSLNDVRWHYFKNRKIYKYSRNFPCSVSKIKRDWLRYQLLMPTYKLNRFIFLREAEIYYF